MINCIGFLPKGINIERLKKFEKDEAILEKLSHLDLPIIENEEPSTEEFQEEEFVVESDLLVYSTPNSTELSYLQFHVYDQENDDFVIHHDIYVFSTINDTEYIGLNDNHYVALGTFENHIMLYDALTKNPMTPQILLEGHSGPVMALSRDENSLFSGSEDRSIMEWDLEKLTVRNKFECNQVVEKLCVSDDVIMFGNSSTIYSYRTGEEYQMDGNLENCIVDKENIYITTSSGTLTIFDKRNLKCPKISKKIFDQPLTGLDVVRNYVALSSLEGDIVVLNTSDLEIKYSHKVKNEIYSIKLSEENVLFFGDGSDLLNMKRTDEYLEY